MTPGELWTEERTIEVHCDDGRHPKAFPRIEIGVLTSRVVQGVGDSSESWDASGPHIKVSRGLPPRHVAMQGVGAQLAAVAVATYRFRCPACGMDVLAGDRFGGHDTKVGFAVFEGIDPEATSVDVDEFKRRVAVGLRTQARLTTLADSGMLRLSLTGLAHILQM